MDVLTNQFPCLGMEWLGLCSYDPAKPFAVYFGIGDAVAALAIIMAVQQVMKPIFRFRLEAYNLKVSHCLAPVFIGFCCVMIATILPSLGIHRRSFLSYPIIWEISGGLCMLGSYLVLIIVTLTPARVYEFNLQHFVLASIRLLASANEEDHARFALDLFSGRNLEKLIEWTKAFEQAESHAWRTEFGRRQQAGEPTQYPGRSQVSAFYQFSHRDELNRGHHAAALLGVLADEHFCSTLVRRCGIPTATALRDIARKSLHNQTAESFVQEISRQAILNEDSMFAREMGYQGFARVRVLSEFLYSNYFILEAYNPFDFTIFLGVKATPAQLTRFNAAAKRGMTAAITHGIFNHLRSAYSIKHIYESVFMDCRRIQNDKTESYALPMAIHEAVKIAIDMANLLQGKLICSQYQSLYLSDAIEHQPTGTLECLADIVFDAWCGFANEFIGVNDPFWTTAIDTFMEVFPEHGTYPEGMTPFQQRVAQKLVKKLKDNMDGYYPAICRVLLACVGPYSATGARLDLTAAGIFRNAVYSELQKLPALAAMAQDKVVNYLPENVSFDSATGCLTHTYYGGQKEITDLTKLDLGPASLATDDVAAFIPTKPSDDNQWR